MNADEAIASARTFLFVPADRLDRCEKAITSAADIVIIDLEDGVASDSKAAARESLRRAWRLFESKERVAIRINAENSSDYLEDVLLCQSIKPCSVVVPKADDAGQLSALTAKLMIPLLPMIESATGLAVADRIAQAPGVARLMFGNLDFALDLGMQPDSDETELASVRLAIVAASRRAGIATAIDGVTPDLHNPDRLIRDVQRARRFGFGAKLCIHPAQLKIVQIGFSPSPEEVAEAREIVAASLHAGGAAIRHRGRMIDLPVLKRAETILKSVADGSIDSTSS